MPLIEKVDNFHGYRVEHQRLIPHRKTTARYAGGPHGFGDPDDKTLSDIEMIAVIPDRHRKMVETVKCREVFTKFAKCGAGVMFPNFKCKDEVKALRACCEKWMEDKEFEKQVVDEYMQARTEYRRTGIPEKNMNLQMNRFPR